MENGDPNRTCPVSPNLVLAASVHALADRHVLLLLCTPGAKPRRLPSLSPSQQRLRNPSVESCSAQVRELCLCRRDDEIRRFLTCAGALCAHSPGCRGSSCDIRCGCRSRPRARRFERECALRKAALQIPSG